MQNPLSAVSACSAFQVSSSIHEKEREFQGRVFRMETGDELGLCLGQIERDAVCLGERSDQKYDKPDELRNDKPSKRRCLLGVDDPSQIECSCEHHDTDHRCPH